MNKLPHLRVFLSSPGDVEDERAIARNVIRDLPLDPFLRGRINLEVVAWEERGAGPLLARMSPQEAINRNLPLPSECDIVIVILWSRMGTPLPTDHFKKPDGTAYLSGTEWEYENAMSSGNPVIIVYRRNEDPLIKLSDPLRDEKILQWENVQSFFNNFSNKSGYNLYDTPEGFRVKLEDDLKVIIKNLLTEIPTVLASSSASINWGDKSPFPGLRALGINDAPIFFGRGRETDGLIERLNNPSCRFIAVVGASGSGKSSLVGAGLIPRLKDNAIIGSRDWVYAIFRLGGRKNRDPLEALVSTLIDSTFLIGETVYMTKLLRSSLMANQESIYAFFEESFIEMPPWSELLLVIDQFEELFTLVESDYRDEFVKVLSSMATSKRIRIIVTLRADFYSSCIESSSLAELLKNGTYPLASPKMIALYEMITKPVQLAGLGFEPGLSETILADTGDSPGSLPLMAYTLEELYNARERTDGKLTWNAYNHIGGVQGAIGTRAESIFSKLDSAGQSSFHEVFKNLVEVDVRGAVIRKQAKLTDLVINEAAEILVSSLTEARLFIRTVDENNDPVVEVAHESLFVSWPRLASWIESMREDLRLLSQIRVATHEWEEYGYSVAYCWPNERLKLVEQMMLRLNPSLTSSERLFIRPEQERLYDELDDKHTSHERRHAIGDRLQSVGDTRNGVGVNKNGVPEINWLIVNPGLVTIESKTQKINKFYISKYPVTFNQFQAFVDDDNGYKRDQWWLKLARKFVSSEPSRYKIGNYPRGTVNWYEAIAFCRWLTWKYKETGFSIDPSWSDWEVRLPTEFEWQLAATGGNPDNIYPWGPEWNDELANTFEAGLGRPMSVGMYPLGVDENLGALDMSGGVWEWCLNRFKLGGGENEVGGEATRVFRGGSFTSDAKLARTIERQHSDPLSRRYDLGFRIIVSDEKFIT